MRLILTFALAVLASVGAGHAQNLNGWCFPANACTGAQMPIVNGAFLTCEDSCVLTNPVGVRGLDATLYDQVCRGDWMPNGSETERVLTMWQGAPQGGKRLLYITRGSILALERCR